jgi:hypothetical protein
LRQPQTNLGRQSHVNETGKRLTTFQRIPPPQRFHIQVMAQPIGERDFDADAFVQTTQPAAQALNRVG